MRLFRPLLAAHDHTEQQRRVLRALAPTPAPRAFNEMTEDTFLLGPSLSRIVANLEQRGLVARDTVAHDQRRIVLSLTPAGTGLVELIAPESEARYRLLEQRFGRERLAELLEMLADLESLDAVDDAPVEGRGGR
jgi:homoprotocatechuate degradation regulator HpaR